MKRSTHRKFLALLLALAMVISMLPVSAMAAEGEATYTKVALSNASDITAGAYLIYGISSQATDDGQTSAFMSTTDSTATRLMSADLEISDGTVSTNDKNCVWNLLATEGGFYIQNAGNSKYLYYGSKTGNNIYQTSEISEAGVWAVVQNGDGWTLQESASGRQLSCNRFGSAGSYYLGFAAYASTSSTKRMLEFYKLESSEPSVDYVPIAEALAGAADESFTVKGVVTLVDGKNIYIQDATGGIDLYFSTAPTDISLGDTVIGTGSRTVYKGLPELANASYEKSSGLTLTAKETTIGALTDKDICTYISLKGVEVTEVYDKDGTYSSPNITVKDAEGNSIQLYKAVVGKTDGAWDVKVGDKVDITAAVGINNTTLQLRNTLASEITAAEPEPTYHTIAEALAGAADESFTVKGVVTLVDGKNIYIQDATGGIDLYFSTAPTDISLGDTIIGTGSRTTYNGLPELAGTSYEKSSGLTLTAKETTIGALTDKDICTYISLKGVEVTEVYDKDGTYSSPNITVKDAEGNSIQLYKAVVGKTDGAWDVKVGDTVDIKAAVSVYKTTTLQLRNTLASEVTLTPKTQYAKLTDSIGTGDQFVIYYNKDSFVMTETVSGKGLAGTAATPAGDFIPVTKEMSVLTADVDADGNYTFTTADGKYLTSGATGNSLSLADAASEYSLWTLKAVTGGFHIVNVNAAYNGNAQALEIYNGVFTTFSEKDTDYYLFNLYKLTDEEPAGDESGLPAGGDQVVIYNLSAQGVLAAQDDNVESPSINGVGATIADGKAAAENGGVVFTVEKNGDYFRFVNETYGYLCSNGTGNNAFYAQEASEDADWTLAVQGTGYTMESRTAKYNDKYSQYLEYYADSYKTYSMYNVTDYDIYTFQFYPCANKTITGGIVNEPAVDFGTLPEAYVGQDYTFSFTVDAVFGVDGELTVQAGGTALTANEDGSYTIPADAVKGESLTITVSGTDTKGVAISGTATVTVKDEPVISDLTPAAGSETKDDKRPTISASISNAGEDPTVTMTVNGETVDADYADGKITYTPAADMADGRTTVTVTVVRADGKEASKSWSFTVGEATYQLYFGQLHSHTTYSDGSGSLDSALDYVKNLPDSANVDFVAFTDHSNYFDKSGAANPEGALYDMSLATKDSQDMWSEFKGKVADFNANQSAVVALGGFEMTWSGGPGHINTWNTPGIVSRNNSTLNNKTGDAGLKAYYALLSQTEGASSLSQLNHPGSTFGTFADFAYWDPVIDSRVFLVEVGNGEGQIGAGGYYPSYEYYTMALDKGWHVAPTNNQDNHKGKWGNANDARDVILTDDFSEQGLYDAIRNYRVYATEDKNLEIGYTVNDLPLGSSISEVPEKLNIAVTVNDPDASDSISKVEVIVNSGKVAYTWDNPTELASGNLECTLSPDYSYYYIRVTEGDGDLAVTAPVWVGESLKLGISSLECGTATPVTDEELTLTTTLFNSETSDATVKSITYTAGSAVLGTDNEERTLPASGTLAIDFKYTPKTAKVMTITATVVIEQDGKEYTFTKDIKLDVLNADSLVYIGIDASHYNEYVAGNYKDSMGNFGALAAEYSVRTVQLNTSADLIDAANNKGGKYKAIVLTAPSRRDGSALRDPYATYSEDEIAALVAFNKAGGTVVLCGWGDFYESYSEFPQEDHMSAQQNKVLAALGSSIRVSDDETKDDTYNGGQSQRLYLSSYNFDSFLLDGVEYDDENPHNNMYTELYSQYGGASIYVVNGEGEPTATVPGTVTPVVYGFETTYSSDDDKDSYGGLGSITKYNFDGADRLMVMATEQLDGQGLIVVSGAAFLSNFEVQATISDSGAEKNYSNYKICENLVQHLNPVEVTDIAKVRAQADVGYKYTIEGVVTSNASGYDKDTAFFDCIYVQDATGGICCFPVAGHYKIGDVVRVTGTTDFFQGEPELQVTSIAKTGETKTVEPTAVSAAQINDRSAEGKLVTVSGTVESFEEANGLVQTIMVKDAEGNVARVFIDGYITTATEVENLAEGNTISATGLASYDDTFNAPDGPFPRIRIRNRADVVCTIPEHDCATDGHLWDEGTETTPATCTEPGVKTYTCKACNETRTEEIPALGHQFVDGTCDRCGAKESVPTTPVKPSWKAWLDKLFEKWWGDDTPTDPAPEPDPTPDPDPDPTPEPDPDPTPEPDPEPDPDPTPEPDPNPNPNPDPWPPKPDWSSIFDWLLGWWK